MTTEYVPPTTSFMTYLRANSPIQNISQTQGYGDVLIANRDRLEKVTEFISQTASSSSNINTISVTELGEFLNWWYENIPKYLLSLYNASQRNKYYPTSNTNTNPAHTHDHDHNLIKDFTYLTNLSRATSQFVVRCFGKTHPELCSATVSIFTPSSLSSSSSSSSSSSPSPVDAYDEQMRQIKQLTQQL